MPGPGPGGPMRGPMRGYLTEEEKANRPVVTKALLVRIFSYLKPYWKQLSLVLICILLSSVLSLLPSLLTGRMIDEGLIGRNLRILIILIVLSFGVTLLSNLIGVGQGYLNNWIAQHISFDMRNQMYRHLQQMSQSFFTANNQGDIITRMTSDISGVESVISSTFTSILSNSMTLIAALVAMLRMNWILTLTSIAAIPLFIIPTRIAGKTRWTITREAQALNGKRLQETMSGKSAGKRVGRTKNKRRIFGNAEKISYLCGEKRNNI